MKKCTGESGDIGDIAKNVNIAMQKSHETIEIIETVGGIGPKWSKMIPKRLKGQQLPTINQQLLIHEWSELNEKCLKSLKNLMQKKWHEKSEKIEK